MYTIANAIDSQKFSRAPIFEFFAFLVNFIFEFLPKVKNCDIVCYVSQFSN